jgi:hypothetical protein
MERLGLGWRMEQRLGLGWSKRRRVIRRLGVARLGFGSLLLLTRIWRRIRHQWLHLRRSGLVALTL